MSRRAFEKILALIEQQAKAAQVQAVVDAQRQPVTIQRWLELERKRKALEGAK
jgi:macrodomain Ter protein organizer (MatP/YcbG family)